MTGSISLLAILVLLIGAAIVLTWTTTPGKSDTDD